MRKLAEWYLKRYLEKYYPQMEIVIDIDEIDMRYKEIEEDQSWDTKLKIAKRNRRRRMKLRPYFIIGSLLLVMCVTWYFQGFLAMLTLFNTIILLMVIEQNL